MKKPHEVHRKKEQLVGWLGKRSNWRRGGIEKKGIKGMKKKNIKNLTEISKRRGRIEASRKTVGRKIRFT